MIIQISFNEPINVSVQIGDMAYYTSTTTAAGFATSTLGQVVEIGVVTKVVSSGNTHYILVDVTNAAVIAGGVPNIPNNSFIMFAKDNTVNISGVLGHYANVTMRNLNTSRIELYSLGSDVIENSK